MRNLLISIAIVMLFASCESQSGRIHRQLERERIERERADSGYINPDITERADTITITSDIVVGKVVCKANDKTRSMYYIYDDHGSMLFIPVYKSVEYGMYILCWENNRLSKVTINANDDFLIMN